MNKLIILIVALLSIQSLKSQNVIEIYRDDDMLSNFFYKKDTLGNTHYYNSLINLVDSLPDGIYIFYANKRKDSLSKKRRIWIKGEFANYKKTGEFVEFTYNPKKYHNKIKSKQVYNYKNGLMDGKQESFQYFNENTIIMHDLWEYKDGQKDGLFIHFDNGYPVRIEVYKNDTIVIDKELDNFNVNQKRHKYN